MIATGKKRTAKRAGDGNSDRTARISRQYQSERTNFQISVPPWAEPLRQRSRYKAAWGGRGGGKSHFFAEMVVERMVNDPDLRVVCIREIQKSLKFSAKYLIESKIRSLGVVDRLEILATEIRRRDGQGILIFQGMQDHTAESIKSLEGFGIAWIEEAQSISQYSLDLLLPTIRTPGSEIWATWNPVQPGDAIDKMFRGENLPESAIVVRTNYTDNPHASAITTSEAEHCRATDTDKYNHVWLGGYAVVSDLQVLGGKWAIAEFDTRSATMVGLDGPYYGADWGFGSDPTTCIIAWVSGDGRSLYLEHESHEYGLELNEVAGVWIRDIPGVADHVVRADNSQPQSINHVKGLGIPRLVAADKWPGSIEDGIKFLRSFDKILVHPRCRETIAECRLYSHKQTKGGDILPDIVDKHNHLIDALRYALAPLIRKESQPTHAPIPAAAVVSPAIARSIFA